MREENKYCEFETADVMLLQPFTIEVEDGFIV